MLATTCSIVIMTHPARIDLVERIRRQCEPLPVRIVTDPEPDGKPTPTRTARLAWAAFPSADYHLCLQDDVILCSNFVERLGELLDTRPTKPVALFTMAGSRTAYAARLAALDGLSWAPVVSNYVPAQALLVPAPTSKRIASFLATETPDEESDDFAIRRLFVRESIESLVCIPNLVDHDDVPSLYNNGIDRRSVLFHTEETPVNWGEKELPLTVLPFQEWGSARAFCQLSLPRRGATAEATPTSRHLRAAGMTRTRLLDAFRDALAEDFDGALEERIGWGFLLELWLTAMALGFTSRTRRDDLSLEGRAALATMPAGALRGLVPAKDLSEVNSAATGFLADAACAGMRLRLSA